MIYEDFKYVIQDFSSVQIGAKYLYGEMLQNERIPFKWKTIVQLYIMKEAGADTEFAEHLLNVKPEDFSYNIFSHLKIKIRFCEPKEGGGFKNIQKKFDDFKKYQNEKWTDNHIIMDVTISNLALMGFSL